jgi:hypothetical protein
VKDLKNGKAPGEDNISGEVIKALGEKAQDVLHGIIQDCYESGKLPEDFKRSLMVTKPKRARAEKCEGHRKLSLVFHAFKVFTRMVGRRIEGIIEKILSGNHFGFRKNRGKREAILCLRLLIEKMIHVSKPLHVAFVDLEKPFDSVEWNTMFSTMEKLGMD